MKVKIKRILVPIDYSENANVARQFADAQAERFKAEVNLLHVVDNSSYEAYMNKGIIGEEAVHMYVGKAPPGSKMDLRVRKLLDGAKAELDKYKDGGKRKYKTKIRQGNVVEEILAEIEEYKPDLVVMCTHGLTGLKHLVLGSVTEKVVRLSPVPVLTTRGAEAG